MPGVKDLKLYHESVNLAAEVVRAARHAMRKERNSFLERLISTASALPETIAEGYGRSAALDQQRHFEAAARSLSALETQLAIAKIADLLPPQVVTQAVSRAAVVGKLLTGYLGYIEKQRAAEREEGVLSITPSNAASPLRKTLDEIYCA
jgi:four helix bundle protein